MNGIICVDKPQEFTSFDITAIVRKKFGTKKVGHGGTLDPMATGVLPVFIGSATKAVDLVFDKSKSYRAGFRLGISSDTLDIWGELTEQRDVRVSREELERAAETFRGEIQQVPPMYSALKVKGQKLCDLARKGIEVERQPRTITVSRLEIVEFDGRDGIMEVDCSAGTYIRSLCDDIGNALGTGAVMTSLVRTRSCGFGLSDCVSVEDIKAKSADEIPVWSVERALSGYFPIVLDEVQKRLYLNGVKLDAGRVKGVGARVGGGIPTGELLLVYEEGSPYLLGLAKVNEQGELVSVKQFQP